MKKTELTCIMCPIGCAITVEEADDGTLTVRGNGCPRGDRYARQEVTNPTRVVTSVVRVEGAALPLCPVKTASPVPKATIPACLEAIRAVAVKTPVAIGDVLVEDLAGTGVALVATDNRAAALAPSAQGLGARG